ncbi:MAG: hypothetical protein J6O56_00160 [Bacilli bacterium]|nr:hypothetical protein [Bacilli bacterium]
MALGGILIANFIFILLIIDVILLIISVINFIIFFIMSKLDKNKKWKKIFKIVFGVLTIIFLIPLILFKIFINSNIKDTVIYNGKKEKIAKYVVDDFFGEITYCDKDEIDSYLNKYPALINSKSIEGLLPLGESIKFERLDCVKYFIDKGVSINSISSNSDTGTLEYMFLYDYYDDEMLEYVLSFDNLDINKRSRAMPVAQLYIKSICKDKNISDTELEFFNKMLDKGLDLKDTNGSGTDTYLYVYERFDNVVNIDKLRKIIDKNSE